MPSFKHSLIPQNPLGCSECSYSSNGLQNLGWFKKNIVNYLIVIAIKLDLLIHKATNVFDVIRFSNFL